MKSRMDQIARAAAALPPNRGRMLLRSAIKGSTGFPARDLEETQAGKPVLLSAFESDMQPVCKAIVSALKSGDMEAMRGLRAMLPHLLAEVNAEPALAEALSNQLGRALVAGLTGRGEQ